MLTALKLEKGLVHCLEEDI